MKKRRKKDELLHVNLRSSDASVVTLVMNFCPRSLWGCSQHREARAAAPAGLGRLLLSFPGAHDPRRAGHAWGMLGTGRKPQSARLYVFLAHHLQGCVGSRRTGVADPPCLCAPEMRARSWRG